LQPKW